MWKKIVICMISLVGTFSIAYAYYNMDMSANSSSYMAGGDVTGRINIPPNGITGSNFGIQKGDKVLMGTKVSGADDTTDPYVYHNEPISWQLISYETYTDYGCTKDSSPCNAKPETTPPEISSWRSLSTKAIDKTIMGITKDHFTVGGLGNWKFVELSNRKDPYIIDTVNKSIKQTQSDAKLIVNRNLTVFHNTWNYAVLTAGSKSLFSIAVKPLYYSSNVTDEVKNMLLDNLHIPSSFDTIASSWTTTSMDANLLKFYDVYFSDATSWDGGTTSVYNGYAISKEGAFILIDSLKVKAYIRPEVFLDVDDTVFAVSQGLSSSIGAVKESTYDYTSALYLQGNDPLKLRMLNESMTATLSDIQNSDSDSITKIEKNDKVVLQADANVGNDSNGNPYTVSVIVLDQNNNFVYYKPLETAKGSGLYEFDTTGMATGKYKIAIVNEAYNDTDTSPADSSLISDTLQLEIVEPHKIAYTKTPQTGASTGKEYEYSKNVNTGQVIGKITVNPQGVMPLTYTLEGDGDNSYQNFMIDGLDANNSSSASSLNIKIKNDAPDLADGSLKAGTYKFCVTSTDANGFPDTPTSDTRACTSFTVDKTATTINFNDKTTTKKSITDAATKWSETATATPTSGTNITYSVSTGDVSLIDIDPDTGEITYKGGDAFGSVKIKATVDDDPATGLDNYESSTVEKEIIIYREVGGYVQPDSKSSSTKDPTFTAADANIKNGGTIGTIIGESGTPDTIGGSSTTYTYNIDSTSTHANFFDVNKTTGEIKTTANLSTGTYNIVVTVSDKWSTKNIPVTINVGMAAAEELKFYENKTSSKVITKKSVSFTDKDVEVYAVVKDSSVTNKVKYSIEDNSTNVITVNENTGAVEIKGVGKVTVVAKKAGATGQAEAVAKLEFEVTSGSFDFKYVNEAGEELEKTGDKYTAYKETYVKDKTFHVYTGGNPNGTTVTYELKDKTEAMSDVISVDSESGEVTIQNASKTNQMGKIVIIAIAHDPSGTYSDQSIELPITIEKGTRVVSFAEDPIYATSGKSSITPVIEVDGVPETDGKSLISIDESETDGTAWTDDNKTIKYEYNSEEPKDIKLKVTLPADRNYTIAEAEGTLHIMGADENVLAITTPGRIIYGDHFTIRSTQDDSGSENVQYTFEVNNTTYISSPTITENKAEFDAVKFSGTDTVTVTVTRTADGEVPLSKKVNVKVLPKPIEITIDHKEKLKGEPNPKLTYQDFSKQLVSWNDVLDVIQTGDVKLSTTAKETSNANDYPIKGDSATLNKTYPNYTFTFKENTLTIIEETIADDWYHIELDDGNNTIYNGKWTNKDVNIISDHTDYQYISKDQSTWETPQITISSEGKIEQSFWMKKDTGAITSEKKETIQIDKTAPTIKTITATDTNNKLQNIINQLTGGIFFKPGTAFEITTSDAKDDLDISGTASIDYKIYKQNDDKTYGSPLKQDTLTVTNEKAKVTISDTTGTYKICVLPKDQAGNIPEEETCKELTLKKIDVDIDGDGEDDFNDSDGDGCPDVNIKWKDPSDDKKWIIVNGDRDQDGIPDLNIDSDGDGKVDLNIDTDNDGKPDLNLVILKKEDWKPTECVLKDESKGITEEYCTGTSVKAVINVDTGTDYIPDINIDNKGDFKAHLNISTDGKTASINLVKLHEWKPDKDYTSTKFSYDSIGTGKDDPKPELNIDTDNDGRPDINLDLNGDGTPELNIDGDGDGIPDVNIDATGNGEPDYNIDVSGNGYAEENIIKLTEWKPEKNADAPFPYDTMEIVKKDQVEDGGVIVVNPGGGFLPNHAIKVDNITDQLDEETKKEIANQAGEQEVKTVYDVKFLEDNIETQPNGKVTIKVPIDTNTKHPKLIVEQADGSYKIVEGTVEDGYLTFETDYVGKVSVIGDQEKQGEDPIDEPKVDPTEPEPTPDPVDPKDEPEPTPDPVDQKDEPTPTTEEPKSTVQGSYTNGTGGASTGDVTNIGIYIILGFTTLGVLTFLLRKKKEE